MNNKARKGICMLCLHISKGAVKIRESDGAE